MSSFELGKIILTFVPDPSDSLIMSSPLDNMALAEIELKVERALEKAPDSPPIKDMSRLLEEVKRVRKLEQESRQVQLNLLGLSETLISTPAITLVQAADFLKKMGPNG